MYKFSEKSKEQLNTCHPLLQEICNEAIKEYDFSVLCGFRGAKAQDEAYFSGKSNARWGESAHNKKPSLAVDLAPYPIDWKDKDRFIYLARVMKDIASKKNIQLIWGGDFQSFKGDLGHFEITPLEKREDDFVYEDIPKGMKYRVLKTFQVQTDIIPDSYIKTDFSSLDMNGLLTIEKGFCWDGATGYFDRDTIMRGSCIHDAFCNWQQKGYLGVNHRKQADKLLKKTIRQDGMSITESELVYNSVKAYVELRYDIFS